MGERSSADDKDAMASRFSLLLAVAAFAALALVPTAVAAGVQGQQAVSQPERAVQAAAAPLAPASVCPGQTGIDAATAVQEETMRCMTDYARQFLGLPALADAEELDISAQGKSGDILRCDSFSHYACGREFTYWIEASGYLSAQCWRAGENLAWGIGTGGTVRSIFRAWMRSTAHRQNILGNFSQIGISLQVGELAGQGGTHVWTQHFGSRCG
ncbi:MAG TPA: hypothetical protein VNP96_00010 [Solirubrobacterales bacterium]|nr:hypothetical protein [Solirubrobacterales bacterium]